MHLTASNSWEKSWPILKLVTIYKSTWVILLTGFRIKVIFEKSVSHCISPPPLNTSLYSTTLQIPTAGTARAALGPSCSARTPHPRGHGDTPHWTPALSHRGFVHQNLFLPQNNSYCPVLHSHRDRSHVLGACPAALHHLTDLLRHCCSHSASETSRASEKIQRNRSPTVAQKAG